MEQPCSKAIEGVQSSPQPRPLMTPVSMPSKENVKLLSSNNIEKLKSLLPLLPESRQLQKNETVLMAHATIALHDGDFKTVYSILQRNSFSERNHKELQKLWCDAHYLEKVKVCGRPPSYFAKYDLQKKISLPTTISDGGETAKVRYLAHDFHFIMSKLILNFILKYTGLLKLTISLFRYCFE